MSTPNTHGSSVRPHIRRYFFYSVSGSVQPLDETSDARGMLKRVKIALNWSLHDR